MSDWFHFHAYAVLITPTCRVQLCSYHHNCGGEYRLAAISGTVRLYPIHVLLSYISFEDRAPNEVQGLHLKICCHDCITTNNHSGLLNHLNITRNRIKNHCTNTNKNKTWAMGQMGPRMTYPVTSVITFSIPYIHLMYEAHFRRRDYQ